VIARGDSYDEAAVGLLPNVVWIQLLNGLADLLENVRSHVVDDPSSILTRYYKSLGTMQKSEDVVDDPVVMPEKRRDVRIPCETPMEISWTADGQNCSLHALCIEVSAGGLRFELDQPIPVETEVELHAEKIDFDGSGLVRHSVAVGPRYSVGIEFSQETKDGVLLG